MTKEEFTKMKQELEAYVIFVVAFVAILYIYIKGKTMSNLLQINR